MTVPARPPIRPLPAGENPGPLAHLDVPRFFDRAPCAETDPEAFFPEQGASPREAKRVCAGCPFKADCLQWALDHAEVGVWGGTTERERRRLGGRTRGRLSTSRVAERREQVEDLLDRGWSPAAVAQMLGVAVHVVWHDAAMLRQAAS